jgi:transcriptional/translational regulatory protein YebC/TACO1
VVRVRIFESIINHKINNITAEELLKYAEQFHISVTPQQAKKIAAYLKGKNINIFNDRERTQLIKEIAKTAGPETAREVNKLFLELIKK